MFKTWIVLMAAILMEVAGTTCLRVSDGFSRAVPTVLVFVFYGLSFWGLSLVLKKIEVGPAYAVWSGIGTIMITLIGIFFFAERATALKLASIALIVIGVIGLNLAGTGRAG